MIHVNGISPSQVLFNYTAFLRFLKRRRRQQTLTDRRLAFLGLLADCWFFAFLSVVKESFSKKSESSKGSNFDCCERKTKHKVSAREIAGNYEMF